MHIWIFIRLMVLNTLLENFPKEAYKTIVFLGDFNVYFSNFDTSNHGNTFLDDLASSSLQSKILHPTRVCKNSKTFFDNKFSDMPNPLVKNAISGNNLSSILDLLPKFFILADFF